MFVSDEEEGCVLLLPGCLAHLVRECTHSCWGHWQHDLLRGMWMAHHNLIPAPTHKHSLVCRSRLGNLFGQDSGGSSEKSADFTYQAPREPTVGPGPGGAVEPKTGVLAVVPTTFYKLYAGHGALVFLCGWAHTLHMHAPTLAFLNVGVSDTCV